MQKQHYNKLSPGFTLIELLACLGIMVVLAGVLIPGTIKCLNHAKTVQEIAGARRVATAWLAYASENNGRVLIGYSDWNDPTLDQVTDVKGNPLERLAARRYVYRLAPYLDYQLKGSVLIGKQSKLLGDTHVVGNEYMVSAFPSFGINLTFVGGDYGSGSWLNPRLYPEQIVERLANIHSPSKLLIFASARYTSYTDDYEGYNALYPPYVSRRIWADSEDFDPEKPFHAFGAMDFRHTDRAVCIMADGHVELLSYKDLEDMRYWSNAAAEANDPNWRFENTGGIVSYP